MISAFLAPVLLTASGVPQQWPTFPAQSVAFTSRLPQTPVLEGRVDDAEWQTFAVSDGAQTYLQWEPGTLYWAAKAKAGNDIVLSWDQKGDGWLIGDDNLEVRATVKDANVQVTVRRLDGTDPNGPKWVDSGIVPQMIRVFGRLSGTEWNLEGSFDMNGMAGAPSNTGRGGFRIDHIPSGTALEPAFLPRAMTFCRYSLDTSSGLFSGLTWRPNLPERTYSRDDELNLRYDFSVAPEAPLLRGIDIRGDGAISESIARVSETFPALSRDRKASVTYRTRLTGVVGTGYRVIKATITAADNSSCTLYTSIRLGDVVDMSSTIPSTVVADNAAIIRSDVNVYSLVQNRVDGLFSITAPKEWTISRGQNQKVTIVRGRGRAKLPIEFIVPKGTKGVFPIELSVKVGERTVRSTHYIRVQ